MLFFKLNFLDETNKYNKYFSEFDLYIKIKYNNQIRNSTVILNNSKPVWNESFIFDYENDNKEITLELYDANSENDIIHTASFIPIQNNPVENFSVSIFNISYGNVFYNTQFLNKKITLLDNRNKILEHKIQQIKSLLHSI
jgi:Ca2+-dependent lipid-binding protein